MIGSLRQRLILVLGPLVGLLLTGCGGGLETQYGSSKDASINGTAVFAEMFRRRGDEVRTAVRLTDEVRDWADVIVRFAPYPGLPSQGEGNWYCEWLIEEDGRRLIYVVRDFDAGLNYWDEIVDRLGSTLSPEQRRKAESERDAARDWPKSLPKGPKEIADPDDWFKFERAIDPPKVCKKLEGPWAEGVKAEQAGLILHRPFERGSGNVLLEGDGHPLAIDWPLGDASQILALANGSFALNATLVNPSRRLLASRILDWVSPDGDSRRVVFLDGGSVLAESSGPPSIWDLLIRIPSFRWVAIQMGILGLAACLARAPRLGRPRPEPIGDIERPSAHPEALGRTLARIGAADQAAQMLERYRAWRYGRQDVS